MIDATTYCPGCQEPWLALPTLHLCPPPAAPESVPCPSCGQPKGQGYGCAVGVPVLEPVVPIEWWQIEHDVVLSVPLNLVETEQAASITTVGPGNEVAKKDAVIAAAVAWAEAVDAWVKMGVGAGEELQALGRLRSAVDALQRYWEARR